MDVPIKDIVTCLIKALTKLDNKDEFELYLDTKTDKELEEIPNRLDDYVKERNDRREKAITEKLRSKFPETFEIYQNMIFIGGRLKLCNGREDYIYWTDSQFIYTSIMDGKYIYYDYNSNFEQLYTNRDDINLSEMLKLKPLLLFLRKETTI